MARKHINGITLGIRFSKSFRIPDISGEIVDNILNDPESPFDSKYFPTLTETPSKEKTLYNPDGENLRITTDDIIISIKINDDFDDKHRFLSEEVAKYFYLLFDLFLIENIKRIGIVYHCDFKDTGIINKTIDKITNGDVTNLQNFNLSFSQKKQTTDGFIKKGVKDYINIIYGLDKDNKDKMLAFNFDYQAFFIPSLTSLRKAQIKNKLKESLSELETTYSKWINLYDE